MFGSRMTNAMVDCRKQQPQQITTTMGTLGGLIGEICWDKDGKELLRIVGIGIELESHCLCEFDYDFKNF